MKSLLYIILTLGFITPSFATENTNPPAQTENKVSSDTKDQFLKFILEKAEKYSDKGEKALDKAVDLATQEAPILAKEFITWRIYKHFITGGFPIILFCGFIIGLCLVWNKADFGNYTFNKYASMSIVFIIGSVITFVLSLASMSEILNGIQAIVAPRIYILEQLTEFIKK